MHIPTFLQQNHGDLAVKVSSFSLAAMWTLLYLLHRIFIQSWETIYFSASKRHFRAHRPMSFLLARTTPCMTSCSSTTNLYINTRSSDSTLQPMMSGVGLILSSQESLVATSYYSRIAQMVLVLQIFTPFYMQESLVHIMQMWYIPGLGCGIIWLTASTF